MKLLNGLAAKLKLAFAKNQVVTISYEDSLRMMDEKEVVLQVRETLMRARDFYAMRGRKILSVDLQTHLDFFDDAVRFDRLEHEPMLLPVDTNQN